MRRSRSSLAPAVLLAAVAVLCAVAGFALVAHAQPAVERGAVPHVAAERGQRATVDRPAAILHRWDERRSRAWAHGSVDRLRELYVPGSRAAAADVRLLRRYAERGLRVRGLRTQLLAVEVVARSSRRWTLRVTDRVVGAVAVHAGVRTTLPRDAPTTRLVTLVDRTGEWQVLGVRPVPLGRGSPAWGARR